MASKISISLDTCKENYLVAKCKQNDDLKLEAFIYENGLPLDLTNKEISIQALKADNTYIIQNTNIVKEKNKILAELDRDFTRVEGKTLIEIVLTESSKQNTTFSFTLDVVGSVIKGAVESSNTVTIIEALENKIVEAGAVKEETEQLITSGNAATKGDVAQINASLEQKVGKNDLARISSGTPLFTNSVSNMIDTTRNYVNTSDGYLYIYNSGSWSKTNVKYQEVGIPRGSIIPEKTSFIKKNISKNRFNKADVKLNYMYNNSGGLITVSESYKYGALLINDLTDITDLVFSTTDITDNRVTIFNACFFDENGTFISNISINQYIRVGNPIVVSVPTNAYSIGLSLAGYGSATNRTYMAEKGTVVTSYEEYKPPYYTLIDIKTQTIENKVVLSLPFKYELVVDDTFELFYKGIILANNPYNYNIKVVCNKGKAYKRKYVFTPTSSDIGTHLLTISLYDDNDTLLDSKTLNLIVKAKAVNPSTSKNILFVGDSLMSGGQFVTEVYKRLVTTDGLGNVNFVGTKGTSAKHEGYSGWRFIDFLSNQITDSIVWINGTHDKDATDQHSVYQDANGTRWKLEVVSEVGKLKVIRVNGKTSMPSSGILTWVSGGTHTGNITFVSTTPESGNPFWNETTNSVDFNNYAKELGISTIDYCYILLGWNSTNDSELTYKTNVRSFIDKLKLAFPSIKVTLLGIQVPDIDGFGENYGASWNYYEKLKFVFNLNKWYQDISSEYTNVDFVNIAGQFDTEYNMMSVNANVNVRNATTERVGINGVHPDTSGYYQIADAVYRNLSHKL